MMPSSGSSDNQAFRQALHSSLQEVLADLSFDVQSPSAAGAPVSFAGPTYPSFSRSCAFGASSVPALPSYLRGPITSTTSSQLGSDSVMHTSLSAIGGGCGSHPDLALLNHARSQLLKQQLVAEERKRQLLVEEQKRKILHDSYIALLHAGAVSNKVKAPASMGFSSFSGRPMALDLLLAAQASSSTQQRHQQYQSFPQNLLPVSRPSFMIQPSSSCQSPEVSVPVASAPKPSPNALEALGCSLRNKNDPYIDVSSLEDPDPKDTSIRRTRGGVSTPFPEKLHEMLQDAEKEGKTEIVSFYPHGRAFAVHNPDRFVSEIMPKYFKQSKWNSFARQLNLYGFIRISSGPDAGGYYHELFLRGRPNLCFHMRRVGVPQGGDRRKLKTKQEAPDPDFYSMKPL